MDPPSYFKVVLAVTYSHPQAILDREGESLGVAGFFQSFIISAASEREVRTLLASFIQKEEVDGEIDWGDSEIEPANPSEWAGADDAGAPFGPRIISKSGHAFFP